MSFRLTRPSRTLGVLLLCAGGLAALLIGIRPVLAKPKTSAAAGPCSLLRPQPAEPLQLNTVVNPQGGVAKTVAMEKEMFSCATSPAVPPNLIRDHETFIEIIEKRTADQNLAVIVRKRVHEVVCEKAFPAGTVRCNKRELPIGVALDAPLQGCRPLDASAQPASPVRMNTVLVVPNKLVKTIKVEKEIWRCDPEAKTLADVYLFTELLETPSNSFAAPPVIRNFGISCRKSVVTAALTKCDEIKIGLLP